MFWSIWRVGYKDAVEWYAGKVGYGESWSSDWTKRERIGGRALAMSILWDLRHRIGGKMAVIHVTRKQPKSA
jgi:hypothetical protein